MSIRQKILQVYGMLRTSIASKASKQDLGPLFDANDHYTVGRMVVYNNVLYRCVTAHSGEWDADDFTPCTIDEVIAVASLINLATDFSTSNSYVPPQVVVYQSTLYKCISGHPGGAWNDSHFTPCTIGEVLDYKTNLDALAPQFSSSGSYENGQIVQDAGVFKRASNSGSGETAGFYPIDLNSMDGRYSVIHIQPRSDSANKYFADLKSNRVNIVDLTLSGFNNFIQDFGKLDITTVFSDAGTTRSSLACDLVMVVRTGVKPWRIFANPECYFLGSDGWYMVPANSTSLITLTSIGVWSDMLHIIAGRISGEFEQRI